MLEIWSLSISGLINVLLGFTVFIKNPKSVTNRLFFLLTLNLAAWSLVNHFSIHPVAFLQIYWVRLVLLLAASLCLLVYLTFESFPSATLRGGLKLFRWHIAATLVVMALTQTPFLFISGSDGEPSPTPFIAIFAVLVITLLTRAVLSLITKYRHSDILIRSQLKLIIIGIIGTFSLILVSNLILVVLFNNKSLIPLGSAFTLIFSVSLAYAIVQKRLFDIKAAIARSIGYLLLIGSMALVYSVILFGLVNILFPGTHNEMLRQAISVILVFPLALSFQAIKNFFDRLTAKIFYKDNYDPQVVLGRLGRAVAAEVDLDKVLDATRRNLKGSIKSSFIEFVFYKNDDPWLAESTLADPARLSLSKHISELSLLPKEQTRTILILEDGGLPKSLRQVLDEAGVAISMRLKTQNQTVGYVLFGEKMNGDVYSGQDIKMLRIVANELAIAAQNALRFEQIEQFNLTLQQKVEDATRQLRDSNARLKKLDETKDDFISMASHQLRTPLTSVKGYVSMVLDGDVGKINKQQQQLLNQAFVSSQRMVALIADLLNVSRLRTGKFMIEPKVTNLVELVDGEIVQLTDTAKSRGLELIFQKPVKFPNLMLDETKLRQVVMNFTDNAIYYTPPGGKIVVKLEDKPSSVEFTVTDNGIGVPASERHRLFTKFYRAGNARKARPDGTGLGLFMAKKVVIAQGGALIFATKEGEGSTFGFSFPKAKLAVK